jgi:ABC-type multidrug transport system ATPase subunit
LWDLLFDLSGKGTTFLVTTHYMDEAERCNQVGYLYLSRLLTSGSPADLLSHESVHPPGTRWTSIECEPSSRGYVLLKGTPGIRRATIFGRTLHLLVDADLADEEMKSRLQAGQVEVVQIARVEPSLEDVFVALTEAG